MVHPLLFVLSDCLYISDVSRLSGFYPSFLQLQQSTGKCSEVRLLPEYSVKRAGCGWDYPHYLVLMAGKALPTVEKNVLRLTIVPAGMVLAQIG
jgi:hypothetical protein